jgi:CheY-like chemotaxis protein
VVVSGMELLVIIMEEVGNVKMESEKIVLVCDDDESVLEITKTILEMRGYSVVTVNNCDHVVEKVEEEHPGLILMDLGIPPKGGKSATEELKHDPHTRDIPVILFSAAADLDNLTNSTEADDYLEKPFNIEDLENKVDQYLKAS